MRRLRLLSGICVDFSFGFWFLLNRGVSVCSITSLSSCRRSHVLLRRSLDRCFFHMWSKIIWLQLLITRLQECELVLRFIHIKSIHGGGRIENILPPGRILCYVSNSSFIDDLCFMRHWVYLHLLSSCLIKLGKFLRKALICHHELIIFLLILLIAIFFLRFLTRLLVSNAIRS